MGSPLSGPGIGLPIPQNLYPSQLQNSPYDYPTNRVTLPPGESIVVPAGDWLISLGLYLVLQYLDPITGIWSMGSSAAYDRGYHFVKSDGFNVRVANLTGCPVAAVVANAGSGYVQASTTIVANTGGSTWLPIVGGQLGLPATTVGIPNAGAGYGIAPLVLIPSPPPAANNANGVGGIPATGYAVIASGTVSGFTFTNPGAGYPSVPPVVVLPSPFDPNLNVGITQASISLSLQGSGSLVGALCTNSGAALPNGTLAVTLTIAGAGSSASLAAVILQTVVASTVSVFGFGYGSLTPFLITSTGGAPSAGAISNNPDALNLAWLPRPAQITMNGVTGTTTLSVGLGGTIVDGGLFESAPTPAPIPQNGVAAYGTIATFAFQMGSRPDIAGMQPAP